jgi:ferredoxin
MIIPGDVAPPDRCDQRGTRRGQELADSHLPLGRKAVRPSGRQLPALVSGLAPSRPAPGHGARARSASSPSPGPAAGVPGRLKERHMRIEVDPNRCQGHARCIECAPAVFDYDDVTNVAAVLPGADLEAHRLDVLEAQRGCPEHAITVVAD